MNLKIYDIMPFQKGHPNYITETGRKKISIALMGNTFGFKKGRIPWNKNKKGIQKHSEKTKQKMRISHLGKKYKPMSEQGKRNIGESHRGYIMSESQKRNMSIAHINNPNRKFKDTSIELKVEIELKRRNINYQKQVPLCKIAIVDFYLPEYRIVIQCDGDYWHNLPGRKEIDERQDKVLIFNGFNVYRFWQHEINKDVKECVKRIKYFKLL